MPEEIDLYRAAWLRMKQHGVTRALEVCDEREDKLSEENDLQGVAAWRSIKRAIEEPDRKPKPGDRTH